MTPPALALETAFLSTGLPTGARADAVERIAGAVQERGVTPAFIGVIDGRPIIGLEPAELERLASGAGKLAARDLAPALAAGQTAGTTVSATLFLAHRAGIPVLATGGIGGVHGAGRGDESSDLLELARTPSVVVCSGPKAILDLPATLERLEALGVTVVGLGTDELPAFWTASSGLPLTRRADSVVEVAEIWKRARELATPGALLVCVPPPADAALAAAESESAIARAMADLEDSGVRGPGVTPFLLDRVARYTEGRSIRANLALLENNAAVGAELAALDRLGGKPPPSSSRSCS